MQEQLENLFIEKLLGAKAATMSQAEVDSVVRDALIVILDRVVSKYTEQAEGPEAARLIQILENPDVEAALTELITIPGIQEMFMNEVDSYAQELKGNS